MLKSVEATVEKNGEVHLLEPLNMKYPCRAIVTLFEQPDISETALLSEVSLAQDWEKREEDEAWLHLQ